MLSKSLTQRLPGVTQALAKHAPRVVVPCTRPMQLQHRLQMQQPPSSPSCFQCRTAVSFQPNHDYPGHDRANDMGGPGGQESFPASMPYRRRIEYETFYGVLLAIALMCIAKLVQQNYDPKMNYVLVHDNTKGELDDVKYIPMPKMREQPVVAEIREEVMIPIKKVDRVDKVQRWA
ncbi:hypothetical protein QC761_400420 [Podospora bellae-mahoneyi]|uniref:Uncharacterized protein n=1 Tax=Podospora bellae-mahoneyi TaxID=2093777 RepID=A0ABR0FIZ2_9PEZI|nr:hypothetical protein QC761_400420 [Podospora bellae-mahoneyi]